MDGIILDKNNVQMDKIFIEMRYKDNFLLPEKRFRILGKLQENFPDYKQDSPETEIHCRNSEKALIASVFLNRMVVALEKSFPTSADYGTFKKIAVSSINEVCNILKIQSLARIGVRSYWTYPVSTQQEANCLIYNNYLNFNKNDWNTIGAEPSFTQILLGFTFGSARATLIIVPETQLIISAENMDAKSEQITYLKIDWDYFTESLTTDTVGIGRFIDNANLSIGKYVLPFLSKGGRKNDTYGIIE